MTESGWKPWYEKSAEFDTAQERDDYIRGVFGPPPMDPAKFAVGAASGYMLGWGLKNLWKAIRSR